ncbi:MAG: hypothetical protein V3U51_04180 [Thermoplasmata archaeon]
MDAQKLRTALNGMVVTSDAYSRSGIHTGYRSGSIWARLLRFNK